MPRLLTNGDDRNAEAPPVKDQILKICAGATEKTWEDDMSRIAALAQGNERPF